MQVSDLEFFPDRRKLINISFKIIWNHLFEMLENSRFLVALGTFQT